MQDKGHATPAYRRDIDGLRAVAVVLVVLNHLMFRHFEGGYIGVDVFFVISGYLIGSSLISEFRQGSFSLSGFYERRVRRIFPALLVALIGTTAIAYHFLMPQALVDYARSLLAALLSFSNFFFANQTGYFDAPSQVKPLLHTWSLGVEEQFYVFFPLLLFVVMRFFSTKLRPVLWCLALLTLALSACFVRTNTVVAFFWSPLRAWELLAGTLVSQYRWSWLRAGWLRQCIAAGGLLMILVPAVLYTAETPFPGLAALWPCVGTALVIGAGQAGPSFAGQVLSLQPLTFIGLISYSLYLWHWPLAVFQRTAFLLTPHMLWERNTKLITLGASLLLATLSWWLVETPFRKRGRRPRRRPLFLLNGGVALAIAAAAAAIVAAQGMPQRFPPRVLRLGNYKAEHDLAPAWRLGTCFLMPEMPYSAQSQSSCAAPVPGKKNYLLYGDSTAAQLYSALAATFPEIHFEQLTVSACHPYRDMSAVLPVYRPNCEALWNYVHSTYLRSGKPDAVILAAGWDEGSLQNIGGEIASFQQQGIPVILVGPDISFDTELTSLLSMEVRRNATAAQATQRISQSLDQTKISFDSAMAGKARDDWHVRYISYFKTLCGDAGPAGKPDWRTANGCPLFAPSGDPLISDTHHLTLDGAVYFAQRLRVEGALP